MKLINSILFPIIVFSSSAQTVGNYLQSNTITTAFSFPEFLPDAKSSGSADVGVALSPNTNSFHWNTSNLCF
jgi:hypothetical protein